jgi:hypothetical protein
MAVAEGENEFRGIGNGIFLTCEDGEDMVMKLN